MADRSKDTPEKNRNRRGTLVYCGKHLLPTLLLLITFCALHENPFDPDSPYNKPPVLSVNVYKIDSTEIQKDSASAIAPFTLYITASSHDHFNTAETLPVIFEHSFENITISDTINDTTIRFIDGGRHVIRFESRSYYGATSSREIALMIDARSPPSIKEITAYRDTLPLHPPLDYRGLTQLNVTVVDTNFLADSIFYISTYIGEPLRHKLETDSMGLCHDSGIFNFSFNVPDTSHEDIYHRVKIYIVDGLKRSSDTEYVITFIDTMQYFRGFPPHIDSIYILNEDPILVEDRPICFGVKASDPADPNPNDDDTTRHTTDNSFITFFWDFGNGIQSTKEQPCVTFQQPDSYTVIVTATDDSSNSYTDSIIVDIKSGGVIKPRFTNFSVTYQSAVAPCTIYVSVTAGDDDGYVKSLDFIFDRWLYIDSYKVTDLRYVLGEKKVYDLYFFATDNEGNKCDTSFTIDLTAAHNKNFSP
ncbi:MAG: PKD domain-containing protein [Chitinispirillaceae bacterium]|nr:PKD domain-containing protein [Chitinispirillaceae bacterium]